MTQFCSDVSHFPLGPNFAALVFKEPVSVATSSASRHCPSPEEQLPHLSCWFLLLRLRFPLLYALLLRTTVRNPVTCTYIPEDKTVIWSQILPLSGILWGYHPSCSNFLNEQYSEDSTEQSRFLNLEWQQARAQGPQQRLPQLGQVEEGAPGPHSIRPVVAVFMCFRAGTTSHYKE